MSQWVSGSVGQELPVGAGGRFALALCAAFVLSAPAWAQDTTALTLGDAIRIAQQHNPTYRSTLNDQDAAAAGVRQAWGAFLPSASANLGFSAGESRVLTGTDQFGHPVRRADPLTYHHSGSSQGASLGLTLFDRARLAQLHQAHASAGAATARIANQRVILASTIATDYYNALHSERLIALADTQLASARAQLAATQKLFRVAAANRVDVLGAQVDVATRQQDVANARGAAEKAKLTLRRDMGMERDVPFTLASDLPTVFDPSTLDADSLVAEALRASPNLAALSAARDVAAEGVSVAHAQRWPTLSLGASVNRNVGSSDYSSLFDLNPLDRSVGASLSVSVPLFRGFSTSASVAQAKVARADADENLRDARLATEQNVRSALIDLRNAYSTLQLAQQSAELSRQRVELAREQYRVSAIPFTSLQQVIASDAQAQRAELDARFAFVAAWVTVQRSVGREITLP